MFPESVIEAAKAHALASYPSEACGFVKDNVYIPKVNIHPEPHNGWTIEASEWIDGDEPQAVIHSHTNAPLEPSEADMISQMSTGVLFGLLKTDGQVASDVVFWGPGVPIPPLNGRGFRWGPSGSDGKGDCYALIRDWYKINRNIDLPEFARDAEFWKDGKDLYTDGYAKAGFKRVSRQEAQDGDIVLMILGNSKVPNHGGILTDVKKGTVLHHLARRISVEHGVSIWVKHITHYLRYDNGEA